MISLVAIYMCTFIAWHSQSFAEAEVALQLPFLCSQISVSPTYQRWSEQALWEQSALWGISWLIGVLISAGTVEKCYGLQSSSLQTVNHWDAWSAKVKFLNMIRAQDLNTFRVPNAFIHPGSPETRAYKDWLMPGTGLWACALWHHAAWSKTM